MDREHIFDTVRGLLGRSFRNSEIAALDAAIDSALQPDDPEPAAPPKKVSEAGLNLIKEFEGCSRVCEDGSVSAYQCPAGVWTIGWGATGGDVGPDTVWDQERCDSRLEEDVARHATEVVRVLNGAPTTQGQFDALVSFHYNTGAIGRATLTRKHMAGDYAGAAREFGRWNKAAGRVLAGLTRRRAAEVKLYRS